MGTEALKETLATELPSSDSNTKLEDMNPSPRPRRVLGDFGRRKIKGHMTHG